MFDFAKIWYRLKIQFYNCYFNVKEIDWLELDRRRQNNYNIQRTIFFNVLKIDDNDFNVV